MLVLGTDSRSFLSVIRSLGRQRLRVDVGWSHPDSIARHSKYINKVQEIPAYSAEDDSWKQSLLSIIRQEGFDLVIPCHDWDILPLQAHRKEFQQLTSVSLLDDSVFEIVFDKIKTHELAESLGIPVARSIKVSKLSDLELVSEKFQLPVVIKPRSSYSLKNLSKKNMVLKAHRMEMLRSILQESLASDGVLVQENITGSGVGVEVLAKDGKILVAFQHVRIHEPIRGGGSTYRKSVPLQPELLDATTTLLRALKYTGVAMVEFKVNYETGNWILVEINGRFWGSLPLALAAGVDFPFYLYQLLVERKTKFPSDYKTGIYCRNFMGDLGWMVQNFRADKNDPTLATLPLGEVLWEVTNVLLLRERNDAFVSDDPKPGWMELRRLLSHLKSVVLLRLESRWMSLPLVRQFYARQLKHALANACKILFVCKGNICRSPFAESYARQVFQGRKEVSSCGHLPLGGRSAPEKALKVAREFGINLSNHSSRVISESNVRESEIILVFDQFDYRTLIRQYPFARKKILRLGLLSRSGVLDIPDPFGQGEEEFREVYQEIRGILNLYAL